MRKTRFTEQQMVAIIREQDNGTPVEEICRKYNIANQTFYKWKKKFSGMEPEDVQKMRELEAENARLKRIVANQTLEIEAVREILKKKW